MYYRSGLIRERKFEDTTMYQNYLQYSETCNDHVCICHSQVLGSIFIFTKQWLLRKVMLIKLPIFEKSYVYEISRLFRKVMLIRFVDFWEKLCLLNLGCFWELFQNCFYFVGNKLLHKQSDVPIDGWAFECRVYAEVRISLKKNLFYGVLLNFITKWNQISQL